MDLRALRNVREAGTVACAPPGHTSGAPLPLDVGVVGNSKAVVPTLDAATSAAGESANAHRARRGQGHKASRS
jgi:hypothetical protein